MIWCKATCSICGTPIKGVNLVDVYDQGSDHFFRDHRHVFFKEPYETVRDRYFAKKYPTPIKDSLKSDGAESSSRERA
jgi:hypothetical protein